MILWCSKCGEYRKRGSSEWDECKYRSGHALTPANEKIASEIDAVKARIAGSDKPSEEDMGRLGALEAIKNALVDDAFGSESASDAVEMTIRDGLHAEGGGAFFWIKRGGNWDLVRDDSRELAAASILHKMRYGSPARRDYALDEVKLRAERLRSDGAKKAAAVGKRAAFADGTLWVDLGGAGRRVYGISAKGHGPAVPYEPGSRVILKRHGLPMPEPVRKEGDWLGWLCRLLRIRPGQYEVFSAHLCHMFCTHQETPAMVFVDGEGGGSCGKTTAARLVREAVDPVGFGRSVMAAPSRVKDVEEALKSPVVALDYTGDMPERAAGYLAAAREGLVLPGGRSYGYSRIIMAGAGKRPLPGRSITYTLPPVEYHEEPAALHAMLEGAKPYLLYEMFWMIRYSFRVAAGPGGGLEGVLATVTARHRPGQ